VDGREGPGDHVEDALELLEVQDRATADLLGSWEAAREVLGPPGERGLPSARGVRTHSVTHPNPTPKWYDTVGPLKAICAFTTTCPGPRAAGPRGWWTRPGNTHRDCVPERRG